MCPHPNYTRRLLRNHLNSHRVLYWRYQIGLQMLLNIIIGAVVMIIADFIGSTMIQPIQIPVGIVMALLGVPVLFYILIKQTNI